MCPAPQPVRQRRAVARDYGHPAGWWRRIHGLRWSELNQTAAVGGCDSFRAANDIQLAEDAFDVSLYGAFADEKFGPISLLLLPAEILCRTSISSSALMLRR